MLWKRLCFEKSDILQLIILLDLLQYIEHSFTNSSVSESTCMDSENPIAKTDIHVHVHVHVGV